MNREAWLTGLVDALRPYFTDKGLTIPEYIRVSCSWPSRTIRKTWGQCWTAQSATDGVQQICVSPLLVDPPAIAAVLTHELLHACLPPETGHKATFKQGMLLIGLEGKATATHAGPILTLHLTEILADLPPYPHAALSLAEVKKQTTRLVRLECVGCGYVVRTTAKWIDQGLPTCCCGESFEIPLD